MFEWFKDMGLWLCTKSYVPLGQFLETDTWAEITNKDWINTVTYRRDSLDGPIITEKEAIEMSADFDFWGDAPVADVSHLPRRHFGADAGSSGAPSPASTSASPSKRARR